LKSLLLAFLIGTNAVFGPLDARWFWQQMFKYVHVWAKNGIHQG